MPTTFIRHVLLTTLLVVTSFSALGAEQEKTTDTREAQIPPFPAWEEFVNGLRDLWPQTAAKLPASMRNDPQVQQEIGRLMLGAIAVRTVDTISSDGDHPWFLPHLGLTMNVFQPNSDTIYRNARITPGGSYRLRGKLGSLRIFKMAQFGPSPQDTGQGVHAYGYYDFTTLSVDDDGRFDVVVSPTRPAGYNGDWWPLNPGTTQLMVRQVSSDWANEMDPTLAIERLDGPVHNPRTPGAELETRLRELAPRIRNSATFLVDHAVQLREEGYINKLKIFDVVSNLGGLFGQFYYEGAYDLKADEALIVESTVPEQCGYASLILTNELYETTDWYNNQSSLNDSQVRIDTDGILRIVVSAKDPGVPNWLDTAGYPRGVIQGRWTDCTSQPVPTVKKVAFEELRQILPGDTPTITAAQREQIIRDRRAAFQQRPLW